MRTIFLTVLSLVSLISYAQTIKSVLASRNTDFIKEQELKPIPEWAVPVEYLESSGTQYIDSGIYLNYYDVVEVKSIFYNRNSIFGTSRSDFKFNITGTGNTTFAYYVTSDRLGQTSTSYGIEYVFRLGNGKFYIDDILVGIRHLLNVTDSTTCIIFARNGTTRIDDYLKGRIYWFKISHYGRIVCRMIPVRFQNENEEDEGAMFDLVTGDLFRNQGTGSFIIGPDIL